jgi:NitT/TauT family transport system substrate-binding protein
MAGRTLTVAALVIAGLALVSCAGGGATTADEQATVETAPVTDGPPAVATSTAAASPEGDATMSPTSADAEPATLRVIQVPVITKAPLYLGIEQGFFKEENLAIDAQAAQTGAAVTAAVVSGEAEIGSSAVVPQLLAVSEGLPLRALGASGATTAPEDGDPNGNFVVLVGANSDIESVADLNGRTIAVNALQAAIELAVRASADREGADSSTFAFVAIPFPEMSSALEAGRVDAIAVVEPFFQAAVANGHRPLLIAYPYDLDSGLQFALGTFFTSTEYAEQNPDVVQRFIRAMRKANNYAQEHPDKARAIIPTYTRITPEVAAEVSLPAFPADLPLEDVQAQAELMARYGFADEPPDAQTLLSVLEGTP